MPNGNMNKLHNTVITQAGTEERKERTGCTSEIIKTHSWLSQ